MRSLWHEKLIYTSMIRSNYFLSSHMTAGFLSHILIYRSYHSIMQTSFDASLTDVLKTLWHKEILLSMNSFPFCNNVFKNIMFASTFSKPFAADLFMWERLKMDKHIQNIEKSAIALIVMIRKNVKLLQKTNHIY